MRRGGSDSRRELVKEYVSTLIGWGNVEPELGRSKKTSDGFTHYIMLRRTGPRRQGAFVYVAPGTGGSTFRLDKSHAQGPFASARNVHPNNPYQVVCRLKNREAMEEALVLARKALDNLDD